MLKLEKTDDDVFKVVLFSYFSAPPKQFDFVFRNENCIRATRMHPGNEILANQRALFAPVRKL
jgi:aminopeptidase C